MLPGQNGGKDATGKKFNASWKVIFFGCGCTVVFGALLGLWELLMDIIVSPFDIIVLTYLLTFGLIMLVLDSPVPHPKLEIFKLVSYLLISSESIAMKYQPSLKCCKLIFNCFFYGEYKGYILYTLIFIILVYV